MMQEAVAGGTTQLNFAVGLSASTLVGVIVLFFRMGRFIGRVEERLDNVEHTVRVIQQDVRDIQNRSFRVRRLDRASES
jgi:hypothetical protein